MLGGLVSLLELSLKSQHTVWNESDISGESLKTKTIKIRFQNLEDDSLINITSATIGASSG